MSSIFENTNGYICTGQNGIASNSNNLFSDDSCGQEGVIEPTENMGLNSLDNYGGLTKTMALQETSPAIGKGDCTAGSKDHRGPAVPTDQRGIPRKSPCDVGALKKFATRWIAINAFVRSASGSTF